jgi:hypothetical protein
MGSRKCRRKEDAMRRTFWIGVTLLVILAGIAIGVGAYHAGVNHGLAESGRVHEVVRVVGPGYGFPFGLILFPLLFFGIFFLLRGAFWRRRWGGYGAGHWGPGHGGVEELHRRLHEQQPSGDAGGGSPTTA